MTRTAMRALPALLLLVCAGCGDKKDSPASDKPAGGAEPATNNPAPEGGCGPDFDELLQWTAQVLEFKADFDEKYLPGPLDPKHDLEWTLSAGGLIRVTLDENGKRVKSAALPYEQLDASFDADVKKVLEEPTGKATLTVEETVDWSHVVAAVSAVQRLGFPRLTLAFPGKIEIPPTPTPSSIRPQLVTLAKQDERLMEEKDSAIIATVFEHCPIIKDNVPKIRGRTRLERFRGYIDLIRSGMKACECRADLGEVKETIWVRAMLTPFVSRRLEFLVDPGAEAPEEKLEFAGTDDWKSVKKEVVDLHSLIGEKDPKRVLFAVKP